MHYMLIFKFKLLFVTIHYVIWSHALVCTTVYFYIVVYELLRNNEFFIRKNELGQLPVQAVWGRRGRGAGAEVLSNCRGSAKVIVQVQRFSRGGADSSVAEIQLRWWRCAGPEVQRCWEGVEKVLRYTRGAGAESCRGESEVMQGRCIGGA